jgi:hypothetical protein
MDRGGVPKSSCRPSDRLDHIGGREKWRKIEVNPHRLVSSAPVRAAVRTGELTLLSCAKQPILGVWRHDVET